MARVPGNCRCLERRTTPSRAYGSGGDCHRVLPEWRRRQRRRRRRRAPDSPRSHRSFRDQNAFFRSSYLLIPRITWNSVRLLHGWSERLRNLPRFFFFFFLWVPTRAMKTRSYVFVYVAQFFTLFEIYRYCASLVVIARFCVSVTSCKLRCRVRCRV